MSYFDYPAGRDTEITCAASGPDAEHGEMRRAPWAVPCGQLHGLGQPQRQLRSGRERLGVQRGHLSARPARRGLQQLPGRPRGLVLGRQPPDERGRQLRFSRRRAQGHRWRWVAGHLRDRHGHLRVSDGYRHRSHRRRHRRRRLRDGEEIALGTDPNDPDHDDDGVCDGGGTGGGACTAGPDNCPFVANAGQANSDFLPAGDACQCGDIDGDSYVYSSDLALARAHLMGKAIAGDITLLQRGGRLRPGGRRQRLRRGGHHPAHALHRRRDGDARQRLQALLRRALSETDGCATVRRTALRHRRRHWGRPTLAVELRGPRPGRGQPTRDATLPAGLNSSYVIGRCADPLSSSPGQSPTPGPLQIRTRRFPPSGSSVDEARGYGPQIRTVIRGFGSGKSRSRSANRSQVRRLRWLRRQSHLYQDRFTCSMTSSKLLKLPLTPK